MCGRYMLTSPVEAIGDRFRVEARLNLGARYNIAPSQLIPVVRLNSTQGGRELAAVAWGLIPGWMRERPMGSLMINARSETIAEKPSFRTAFRQRRCLIPANGFYEWQRRPDGKHPHYIYLARGALFAFAGIWESWTDPKTGEVVESAAIITRPASKKIQHLHDRMPVMLARTDHEFWLEGAGRDDIDHSLFDRLSLIPDEEILFHEISRKLNKPAYEDPSLLEPWRG